MDTGSEPPAGAEPDTGLHPAAPDGITNVIAQRRCGYSVARSPTVTV
jgi:hypothetical protein